MTKDQIIALAQQCGAISYSPPPMRAVRGLSFTYEQLEAFTAELDQGKLQRWGDLGVEIKAVLQPFVFRGDGIVQRLYNETPNVTDSVNAGQWMQTARQYLLAFARSQPEALRQSEQRATPEIEAEQFIQSAIDSAPDPLRRLGEWLSTVLDEDKWATAERMLLNACAHAAPHLAAEEAPTSAQSIHILWSADGEHIRFWTRDKAQAELHGGDFSTFHATASTPTNQHTEGGAP